ncbi:Pao retrotransposon peptidase family protein [Aphelenchoides avenae]|nr:Pao retrotransposon peptidase family protein [Aphelenchus avenae]
MTAEVPVGNPETDKITRAAVFFDPGSDLTMIKDSLAQRLGLRPLREAQVELETVHSGGSELVYGFIYEVRLHLNDSTARTIEAFSVQTLIGRVKRLKLLGRSGTSEGEVEPEILVGVQDFWDFVNGVKDVGRGLKLVESTVGPMLCGRRLIAAVKAVPSSEEDMALEELSEAVHKAWQIEGIGVTDCPSSKDEEEAVRVFEESVKVNDDGRYETGLLFNTPDPDIPMHKGLCVGRARTVQKRAKAEGCLDEYHEYFMDLIRRKILELAPEVPTGPIEHYVPHHPVYAASKNGKLRIVFDGGARMSKAEKSLTDHLFKGPDMTADLCGSLFRFRLPEVAITADIEKAFLQVSVAEEERDALRVIWARNPYEPISESNMVVYRFCRVVFGLRSSPFLLNGVVKVHLKRMAEKYPTASEVLNSVYVDNIFLGAETGAEALRKCAELNELFAEANMPVREYLSNSKQVMKQFADDPNQEVARVLGVQWDLRRDVLA